MLESQCGYRFYFDGDGSPREHGFNFCPSCGKPLTEVFTSMLKAEGR